MVKLLQGFLNQFFYFLGLFVPKRRISMMHDLAYIFHLREIMNHLKCAFYDFLSFLKMPQIIKIFYSLLFPASPRLGYLGTTEKRL
jgi:hypothetical protein